MTFDAFDALMCCCLTVVAFLYLPILPSSLSLYDHHGCPCCLFVPTWSYFTLRRPSDSCSHLLPLPLSTSFFSWTFSQKQTNTGTYPHFKAIAHHPFPSWSPYSVSSFSIQCCQHPFLQMRQRIGLVPLMPSNEINQSLLHFYSVPFLFLFILSR